MPVFTQAFTLRATNNVAPFSIEYSGDFDNSVSGSGPTIIPFGTTAPTSLPNTTGAVSPWGWPVGFFEDFVGPYTITATSGGLWGWGQCTTGTYTWDFVPCWGGGNGQSNLNRANMSIVGSVATFRVTVDTGNVTAAPFSGVGITTGAPAMQSKWGYWEFNMRMPVGANGNQTGLWGAAWITAVDGNNNWPQEIDVFEQTGSPTTTMQSTLHYGSTSSTDTPLGLPTTLPYNSATAFHTYGCLICPNYIALYADGILQTVRYRAGVNTPSFTGLTGVSGSGPTATQTTQFHYDFDVMQTLIGAYCGQGFAANVVPAQLPVQLQCDWIRFSQLNAN